jgi:hypothetical protein
MKIDLIDLTMRDLVAGYSDDGEGGVRGYGEQLDFTCVAAGCLA